MATSRKVDWFRVLRDLMAKDVSMHQVARACGRRAVNTVRHWADGGEPKYSDARIVLALYKRHCPEKYEALMKEFEPDVLQYQSERVAVKPDRAIRHRPRPDQVWVQAAQFDFFAPAEVA